MNINRVRLNIKNTYNNIKKYIYKYIIGFIACFKTYCEYELFKQAYNYIALYTCLL